MIFDEINSRQASTVHVYQIMKTSTAISTRWRSNVNLNSLEQLSTNNKRVRWCRVGCVLGSTCLVALISAFLSK